MINAFSSKTQRKENKKICLQSGMLITQTEVCCGRNYGYRMKCGAVYTANGNDHNDFQRKKGF